MMDGQLVMPPLDTENRVRVKRFRVGHCGSNSGMETIGQRVRQLREAAGLSRPQLAAQIRLPSGKRMAASTLRVLARLLGTPESDTDRLIDWGWFYFITKPVFLLIDYLFKLLGNFGLAILAVTVIIKIAFFPLANKSYASMAKMKAVQPQMLALRERYKDDKQKQQTELMELYKREKINPLAGCLPILIQIPFFLAFYWVLLESVEMRQAPFLGWITDLSSRDPFFILPVLMGAAMFAQFKLQPMPSTDPMQAKIMMFLPVMFTFMFLNFPSGLVLYWLVNNILSIAQQYLINKRMGVLGK